MNVEQIYSRNIVHAPRSCNLQEAELMRRYHVGALLITGDDDEQNRAIGIVTDWDIVALN